MIRISARNRRGRDMREQYVLKLRAALEAEGRSAAEIETACHDRGWLLGLGEPEVEALLALPKSGSRAERPLPAAVG